jgi:hypothetical protein
VAFAGAAIVAVALGRPHRPIQVPGTRAGQDESAGEIVAVDREGEGDGLVLINGAPASRGAVVRLGDVIEPRGVSVTLERPGKLTMILDHESRARFHVEHSSADAPAGGTLVLTLDRGAVEARVVPVASGQAFAVDVEDSRVAVHGTHFRVARTAERVAVDLREGIISIGRVLDVASRQAPLVAAPAHADFVAADVIGTLTVTREPSALRAPAAIRSAASTTAIATPQPEHTRTEPAPARPAAAETGADRPETQAGRSGQPAAAPRSDADVEGELANAVRACMAERPHAENVTVVVRTMLLLDLGGDGSVRGARFEPPVALDVNECATRSIYKTHFAHGGTVAIPIDFTN